MGLAREKHICQLMDMLKPIRDLDVHLAIIGDGELRERVRRAADRRTDLT